MKSPPSIRAACVFLFTAAGTAFASSEADALSRLSLLVRFYSADHAGALPKRWSDLDQEQLGEINQRLDITLDRLYTFLHPYSVAIPANDCLVFLVGIYPSTHGPGRVGRFVLAQSPQGSVSTQWFGDLELARLCADQSVPITNIVRSATNLATNLGYTADHPRPVLTTYKPSKWANLPDPLRQLKASDPVGWSNMVEGARETYPEPRTYTLSNRTVTVRWNPSRTNARPAQVIGAAMVSNGVPAASTPVLAPVEPPAPQSRRGWRAPVVVVLVVALGALLGRRLRRRTKPMR